MAEMQTDRQATHHENGDSDLSAGPYGQWSTIDLAGGYNSLRPTHHPRQHLSTIDLTGGYNEHGN